MPQDKAELAFKRHCRSNWDGWSEAYEPGTGSGNGYPDLQFLEPDRKILLPVELKVGSVVGDRVIPREVRPAQVVWHRAFGRSGGTSVMLIGVRDPFKPTVWEGFGVPGYDFSEWRDGFAVKDCFRLHPRTFKPNLLDMVRFMTGSFWPHNLAQVQNPACIL